MTQLKVWHKVGLVMLSIALVAVCGFLIAFTLVDSNSSSNTTTTSGAIISPRTKTVSIEANDIQPIPFQTTPGGQPAISSEFVELPKTSASSSMETRYTTPAAMTTTPPPEITTTIILQETTPESSPPLTSTTPAPATSIEPTLTTTSAPIQDLPSSPIMQTSEESLTTATPSFDPNTTQSAESSATTPFTPSDELQSTPVPSTQPTTDTQGNMFTDAPPMGETMMTSASTPASISVTVPYTTTTTTIPSTTSHLFGNDHTNPHFIDLTSRTPATTTINPSTSSKYNASQLSRWDEFTRQFPKPYQDDEMVNIRRDIFMQNLAFIDSFNADPTNTMYKLGVNQFADMTTDEINMLLIGLPQSWSSLLAQLGAPPVSLRSTVTPGEPDTVSGIVDWRNLTTSFAVNQGDCRDGAAFAVLSNIEAVYNKQQMQLLRSADSNSNLASTMPIDTETLSQYNPLKLSEHQILNCMRVSQKSGDLPVCSGHLSMVNLLEKLQSQVDHTLISDPEYARIGALSPLTCALSRDQEMELRSPRIRVTSFNQLHANDILEALDTIGPLTVAIDATKPTFHFYKSGLYQDHTCSEDFYNHHLLLVGYLPGLGSQRDKPAYLARNSFGGAWGEGGYIRLLDRETNTCLPKHMAIYPNIEILS